MCWALQACGSLSCGAKASMGAGPGRVRNTQTLMTHLETPAPPQTTQPTRRNGVVRRGQICEFPREGRVWQVVGGSAGTAGNISGFEARASGETRGSLGLTNFNARLRLSSSQNMTSLRTKPFLTHPHLPLD